jgi:hypothetical protein
VSAYAITPLRLRLGAISQESLQVPYPAWPSTICLRLDPHFIFQHLQVLFFHPHVVTIGIHCRLFQACSVLRARSTAVCLRPAPYHSSRLLTLHHEQAQTIFPRRQIRILIFSFTSSLLPTRAPTASLTPWLCVWLAHHWVENTVLHAYCPPTSVPCSTENCCSTPKLLASKLLSLFRTSCQRFTDCLFHECQS